MYFLHVSCFCWGRWAALICTIVSIPWLSYSNIIILYFLSPVYSFLPACCCRVLRPAGQRPAAAAAVTLRDPRGAWEARSLKNSQDDARHSILRPARPAILPPVSPGGLSILQVRLAARRRRTAARDAAVMPLRPPSSVPTWVRVSFMHAASRCRMRLQEQRCTGGFVLKVTEPKQQTLY